MTMYEETVLYSQIKTTIDTLPIFDMTVAEYFAGIGLVRMGLEQAGWSVYFANDIALEKYEMYTSYFADASEHYQIKDIFNLNSALIPFTTLATASFPCIDLSLAGNRNGLNGKHSSAFWGFVNILKAQGAKKPHLVMLENVNGWLTANEGKDFKLTIQALNKLGYACDVFSIDAIRFIPQSRPRLFAIGVQTDKPNQDIRKLQMRSKEIATDTLKRVVLANSNLTWHIVDVPSLPCKKVSGFSSLVEDLPDNDERWWSQKEVKRHLAMMTSSHLQRVESLRDQKQTTYRTMYRRVRNGQQRAEVRKDDIAGCLRTARGGSSKQMLLRMGNGKIDMRHMTPREYARLQGVPDDYPIPTDINQALTGFGDAVCVPVITWIANNILNPLIALPQ